MEYRKTKFRTGHIRLAVYTIIIILVGIYKFGRSYWYPYYNSLQGRTTVPEVISKIGKKNKEKLKAIFSKTGHTYPPKSLKLVALKEEKVLQVYSPLNGSYSHVYNIKILAASGKGGPKRIEGDKQVPEGIYKIIGLNPNSAYYLSMKLNYPNKVDKSGAIIEGRKKLGGDIFIHGKNVSIGCLALGDVEIELLFTLIHTIGRENVSVIIAPFDFRQKELPENSKEWVNQLYKNIKLALP